MEGLGRLWAWSVTVEARPLEGGITFDGLVRATDVRVLAVVRLGVG
jgi:hypothetical protein